MDKKSYRNRHVTMTPEERREYKAKAEKIDREEQAGILAQARRVKVRSEMLRRVVHDLKAERERRHLSLAEVSAKSGIDKAALSRLENAANINPKLDTLVRYADALGVGLQMTVQPLAA